MLKFIFLILFFITGVLAEDNNTISNKFLTKSIVKDLKNDIVIQKESKNNNEDSRWRYTFSDMNNIDNGDINNNGILNIQIPLIWYHERF